MDVCRCGLCQELRGVRSSQVIPGVKMVRITRIRTPLDDDSNDTDDNSNYNDDNSNDNNDNSSDDNDNKADNVVENSGRFF